MFNNHYLIILTMFTKQIYVSMKNNKECCYPLVRNITRDKIAKSWTRYGLYSKIL